MTITYAYLKELCYDDGFDKLPSEIKNKIDKTLNAWYGQSDFDTVEKITEIDIWGVPESDDLSDESPEDAKSRYDALNEAREVWEGFTLEEKFEKFIDISDDSTEFLKISKEI